MVTTVEQRSRRARLVLGWVTIRLYTVLVAYVLNHQGQLSLLPLVGRKMNIG